MQARQFIESEVGLEELQQDESIQFFDLDGTFIQGLNLEPVHVQRLQQVSGIALLEEALADLPVAVTFLRAAWFMENAQWDIASARDQGVIDSYLQPLDRQVAMVATADVGRTAAELLLENWSGHRVIELEAQLRVSPNQIAAAFAKALGRKVEARIVPRERWETIFREQGMRHPEMRMRMLDGFNEGWIDFRDPDAQGRKGRIGIDEAIAGLPDAGAVR